MKFTIKTLKQVIYEVDDNNEDDTVSILKKRVEEKHNIGSETFKLVFNQKILENDKLLKDYNLKDGSVIIMMNNTVKPKAPEKKPEEPVPNTNNVEKKDENKPVTQPISQPTQPSQPKNYDNEINELVSMGFPKEEATACIKAARGNIALALDFISEGIPENLPPEDIGGSDGGFEGQGQATTEEAVLKGIASIIKVACQNDESKLDAMLGAIQQTDPNLFEVISNNQDKFRQLITEQITEEDLRAFQEFSQRTLGGVGGGSRGGQGMGGGQSDGRGRIAVTREEMEAIQRLKAFGFSEMEAAQAYFACDKNEEASLNFLFDNKAREQGDDIEIDYSQFTDFNNQGGSGQGGSGSGQGGSGTGDKKNEEK